MGRISGRLVVVIRDLEVDENDEDDATSSVLSTVRSTMSGQMCQPWRDAVQSDTLDLEDVEFEPGYKVARVRVYSSYSFDVRYDPTSESLSDWLDRNYEAILAANGADDASYDVDDYDTGNEADFEVEDGDVDHPTVYAQRQAERVQQQLIADRDGANAALAEANRLLELSRSEAAMLANEANVLRSDLFDARRDRDALQERIDATT